MPADHRRHELDAAHLAEDGIARHRRRLHALLDDPLLPPEHAARLRVLVEVAGLRTELRRRQDVVVVEERDQVAAREREPRVPRRRQAPVLLPHVAHRERLRDLARPVLRAVVHEDDLERVEVLGEDALERLAQEPLAVEGGHDHSHARVGHRSAEIASGTALRSLPSSSV